MHIELIGCTSAGKTTLAQKIVDVGKRQGIDIILGDDFVLQRLHFDWVKNEFMRRRLLEICSACICLWHWQKYREFCHFVFGVIFQAPGSWFYKINLVRIVLRKIGIHEIIHRSSSNVQMVLVDNEGIVQAAHNLFVHTNGRLNGSLTNFVKSAPLPDMIVYLRQPESILLERTLRRGHPRIRARSQNKVQHFIKQASKTFEELLRVSQIVDRLLVIDSESKTVIKLSSTNGQLVDQACDLMQTSIMNVNSESESKTTTSQGQSGSHCLDLVNDLTELLDTQHISYCHWKSNIDLETSLGGETDLDLFVARKSLPAMLNVLAQLGFKSAKIRYGPDSPGVAHYYGFDAVTGKLVHVHLFTTLLTGESFVKSHRLPFEKMLLEDCDRIGKLVVVSKTAELVLFVLRTFIKYGSLPDILRLAGKSAKVRNELRWLLDGGDTSKALSLLHRHCPVVSESLFLSCMDAISEDRSFFRKVFLALRVRRHLRDFAEYTFVKRLSAYAQLLWAKFRRRLKGNAKNKVLHSGGGVIAIVGPDATGKSTLVSEVGRWLGDVFAVRTVHAGKPSSSWQTAPINIFLPLMRQCVLQLRHSAVNSSNRESSEAVEKKSSLLYAVRAVTLAWDRRRLLAISSRAATKGEIVVCDRYPSENPGTMDSPRLAEQPGSGIRIKLYNRLVQLERRFYNLISPPDIVIKLTVSLDTAKQRNRRRQKTDKHTNDYLEVRHKESLRWSRPGIRLMHEIDTDLPLADTVINLKKVIWNSL